MLTLLFSEQRLVTDGYQNLPATEREKLVDVAGEGSRGGHLIVKRPAH